MSLRQGDFIFIEGANGDSCCISHTDLTWGPYLAPGSTGLFDLALQSNWGNYGFGQFFQTWKPKRRDVTWTVHVTNPETGTDIDGDSDLWHLIYSRWVAMFSPSREAIVRYVSIDGERRLGLRTLNGSQSFSAQPFEGGDPHCYAYGSIIQQLAAEFPYYVGKSFRKTFEIAGTGNFWFTLPYFNSSNVDVFAEWDLTGGATWILPDYSFGNEIYGRGVGDIGKTVPIPTLDPGENVTVMTRPDMEWILSEWETPVPQRSPGLRHEYPIPAGAGSSDEAGQGAGCTVRVLDVIDGAAGELTIPRWYDTPFSTPRVV